MLLLSCNNNIMTSILSIITSKIIILRSLLARVYILDEIVSLPLSSTKESFSYTTAKSFKTKETHFKGKKELVSSVAIMSDELGKDNNSLVDMDFSTDDDALDKFSEEGNPDPLEIPVTCIDWYTPLLATEVQKLPVVPGTKIHPLDPRGQKQQPLHVRLDPRHNNKKAMRLYIPRQIPGERVSNFMKSKAEEDPRDLASAPVHTPSMERISRTQQLLEVRSLNKSAPKAGNVLNDLLADMGKFHGEEKQTEDNGSATTPQSPTKPKGSINVPKQSAKQIASTNDPTMQRPPAPKIMRQNRLNVLTPKFTSKQHHDQQCQKIAKVVASPKIRCQTSIKQAVKQLPYGVKR